MKRFLHRVHLFSIFRHGNMPAGHDAVNVRVFLALYMIAYRTSHVFETFETVERTLVDASVRLAEVFERIARSVVETGGFTGVQVMLTANFLPMLSTYLTSFYAWKRPDEEKLEVRIKCTLVALEDSLNVTQMQQPSRADLIREFETQIARLRGKLVQISGRAALDRFDEQRREARARMSSLQRAGITAGGNDPTRYSNDELAHELLLDPTFALDDYGNGPFIDSVIRRRMHQVRRRRFVFFFFLFLFYL